MQGPLFTPLAKLLQLQLDLNDFLISGRVIVDVLAVGTLEFDEIILRHTDSY